jgi:hypothetical protein
VEAMMKIKKIKPKIVQMKTEYKNPKKRKPRATIEIMGHKILIMELLLIKNIFKKTKNEAQMKDMDLKCYTRGAAMKYI